MMMMKKMMRRRGGGFRVRVGVKEEEEERSGVGPFLSLVSVNS